MIPSNKGSAGGGATEGLAQGRKQQAAAQQGDAREQDHEKAAGNPINGTHNATPSMEADSLRTS
jgi:hypothetical protein